MSWCTRAPPSDHDSNVNSTPESVWVAGAETVWLEPWMDVRERRRRRVVVHRQLQPGDAGHERRLHRLRLQEQALRVLEAAGVGHGQAQLEVHRVVVVGPVEAPLETPVNDCSSCSWQVEGQWWRTSSHRNAEAGSAPALGVGTRAREGDALADGPGRRRGRGRTGAELPTVITIEAPSEAPLESVTRRPTVTCPSCV